MPIRSDIRQLAELSEVFIETGTLMGEGIACAVAAGFGKIVSMELSDEHAKRVDFMFGGLVEAGVLQLLRGDCLELLPPVIAELDASGGRATFWLDADHVKTLYPSLDLIAGAARNDHVILIDDVRIMGKQAANIELDEVIRRLREINPDYLITREMGYQPEDVIMAVPAR